ncbi:MAG TPA: hypothetical protein VKZ53_22130 [Candidatus Angelobacter sp.]|nr:hypothetical protein [Candidatus Angelobacter sp.]
MRKTVLLLGFLVCLAAYSVGQSSEIGLVAGIKVTPGVGSVAQGTQVTFSDTFAFEASYAARLMHAPGFSLHLEFPVAVTPSSDVSTSLNAISKYSSVFFTPGLRLKLAPSSPFSPWVAVGGGFARFNPGNSPNTNNNRPVGAPLVPTPASSNRGAFDAGAGVDFHFPAVPLALRVQARDFYTGAPDLGTATTVNVHHNIMIGAGFVLRF